MADTPPKDGGGGAPVVQQELRSIYEMSGDQLVYD